MIRHVSEVHMFSVKKEAFERVRNIDAKDISSIKRKTEAP